MSDQQEMNNVGDRVLDALDSHQVLLRSLANGMKKENLALIRSLHHSMQERMRTYLRWQLCLLLMTVAAPLIYTMYVQQSTSLVRPSNESLLSFCPTKSTTPLSTP